jgi:tRNA splicing ligase
MNKQELIIMCALVWNYGDVFVDDDEVETHIVKISYDDFLNFGFSELEVYHDDERKVTYYRVRRTN